MTAFASCNFLVHGCFGSIRSSPAFYSLPAQLLAPAFAFAVFPPSLHTRSFSLSSHILPLLAAFASCSFLARGCFGSIRSPPAFWLPSCTQLLVSAFAFCSLPTCTSHVYFHSPLTYSHFWQHSFSHMGTSAAFALLSPFWQSEPSCTQLLVSANAFRSLPTCTSHLSISQYSRIRSLSAAFAHGCFGSIRSPPALLGSLPAYSCLCTTTDYDGIEFHTLVIEARLPMRLWLNRQRTFTLLSRRDFG